MRFAETRIHVSRVVASSMGGREQKCRRGQEPEEVQVAAVALVQDMRHFGKELVYHSVLGHISGCWRLGGLALAPSDAHENSARFLRAASAQREVQV